MAILQVSSAPSREHYEMVTKRLDMDGANKPAGLIVHAAGETGSGEVQIVDVWESAEAFQAFAQQRLFPAFEETGVMELALANGHPTPYDAFHLVRA